MLVKLFCWILLNYGLMNIMVFGSIFSGLRAYIAAHNDTRIIGPIASFISGILSCPMCFSTWGGFFTGLLIYSPTYEILGFTRYGSWSFFFDGIISSGAVWALNSIIEWYENKSN